MVTIELTAEDLVIHVCGWHKLLAVRTKVVVPLRHVVDVRPNPPEASFDDVVVNPWAGRGTYLRGRLLAGSVDTSHGRCFYDVSRSDRALALDLVGEEFNQIVVELNDEQPDAAARRIDRALQRIESMS